MFLRHIPILTLLLTSFFIPTSFAENAPSSIASKANYAYFSLEPDITTNVSTLGSKLTYLKVRIDIMVSNKSDLPLIEHHQPLIRDTIVKVIGQQDIEAVKSIAGRKALRHELVQKVNEALLPELGRTIVTDLLFTKYLYQ